MFTGLARIVVYHPWKVIAAWVIAAFAIIAFAPPFSDVVNLQQTDFLPEKYESVQAQRLAQDKFVGSQDATGTIVVRRTDGGALSADDQGRAQALADALNAARIDRVVGVQTGPQALSENRKVQLLGVQFRGVVTDKAVLDAVKSLRAESAKVVADSGLTTELTGDPALVVDNQEAYDKAFMIVGFVTVLLVIVLLLLIYRSPIAALLPIVSVGLVSAVAPGAIALMAKAANLRVDQSLQVMLTVVLFGVGTDYILFLLFRYRELLRDGMEPKRALELAVRRVAEVITSAAAAIVVTFLTLLAAIFGLLHGLGPGLAMAVGIMAIAALTLVPGIVALIGPRVFWPSKSWQKQPKGTVFARIGGFSARRPGLVAGSAAGLLVVLALGMTSYKVDFDQFSQLPGDTESAHGFQNLQKGFPAGALSPTLVYLNSTDGAPIAAGEIDRISAELQQVPGVGGIMPTATGAAGQPSADGKTAQISVLLKDNPYSNSALDVIAPLRDRAHALARPGTEILVAGPTAMYADIRSANDRDIGVIFPLTVVLIILILAALLRSLVAPLYLMVAVLLSFFATMGATAFLVTEVQDRSGVGFTLLTTLYLFVVAIGTDYNILIVARLREEAQRDKSPREAAALAVSHGGPSVAAAGLILGGTFSALLLAGVAYLTQLGFAVTLGVALSAFVMSVLLVPALTALIGNAAWWPGLRHPQPRGRVARWRARVDA
ncbi:MMPL family transporter [Nocardia pulmonis]|uniref:MMPL family transporter n=2 Tax=Nocardia TaxID=1817 RepID=UPI00255CEEE8|nr:MMPL family transporter [Nocardia pulmonis]